MTENHPITPPPELITKWACSLYGYYDAARWGADQQLEECVAWLDGYERDGWAAEQMRNACRPKPPSLAEEALDALRDLDQRSVSSHPAVIVRRALEKLQELEKGND